MSIANRVHKIDQEIIINYNKQIYLSRKSENGYPRLLIFAITCFLKINVNILFLYTSI